MRACNSATSSPDCTSSLSSLLAQALVLSLKLVTSQTQRTLKLPSTIQALMPPNVQHDDTFAIVLYTDVSDTCRAWLT